MTRYREFYENIDRETCYTAATRAEEHSVLCQLQGFIEEFNLHDKKCLEIGSAKGIFQHLVPDYTGLDIAASLAKYYEKPYFLVNNDRTYPFEARSFDAIWSFSVHEQTPHLNQALGELNRILKPGGVVLFSPAWQCRPWAAQGYAVRPYGDFGSIGKIIKALIPLRNSVWWRSLFIFPQRLWRHLLFLIGKRYTTIYYKKLRPNYERFWISDSDACNSIDPHAAILWFESNGCRCLSHPLHMKAFFIRTGALIFRKLT